MRGGRGADLAQGEAARLHHDGIGVTQGPGRQGRGGGLKASGQLRGPGAHPGVGIAAGRVDVLQGQGGQPVQGAQGGGPDSCIGVRQAVAGGLVVAEVAGEGDLATADDDRGSG